MSRLHPHTQSQVSQPGARSRTTSRAVRRRRCAAAAAAPHSAQQQQQHHHHQQQQQHEYTAVDATQSFKVFTPRLLDIASLLAGSPPTPAQAALCSAECAETGFLAITGHGMSEQLPSLFEVGRQLFDLPLEAKRALVVGDMRAGRGWEVSPEHLAYMQGFEQQLAASGLDLQTTAAAAAVEPSARCGIVSERFCCGPELTPAQQQDTFYSSDLGRVFFGPNAWPAAVPQLAPRMLRCYAQCEAVAGALMRLFAVALGLPAAFFEASMLGHHSNLQLANYPSQLLDLGSVLRKKAHADSGVLTLLASEDFLPGSTWRAGDGRGGLQLLCPRTQEWLEVAVPPGALLVNLGTLMTRATNTLWSSTLHRVTNPAPRMRSSSRRLSMAYFAKLRHDAVIEVLPTCYNSSSSSSSCSSSALPPGPLFEAAVVGDLTRQGFMHSHRHLSPEVASAAYHEQLASMRQRAV